MQSPLDASPSTRAPWRPPCSPRAPWGPSCPHRTLGAFPSTQSPLGATHPRGALGPGRVSPLACISIQVWEPLLEEFVPIFDALLAEVSPPAFRQGCGPQIPVTVPPPTCPPCCPQGHLRCLGRGSPSPTLEPAACPRLSHCGLSSRSHRLARLVGVGVLSGGVSICLLSWAPGGAGFPRQVSCLWD